MQTGIIGSEDRLQCWKVLNGENTNLTWVQDTQLAKNFDVFIDLNFDLRPETIAHYAGNTHTIFFLSAVNITPEQAFLKAGLSYQNEKIFGINAIPTFLERTTAEVTNPFNLETEMANTLLKTFGYEKTEWVGSRVGMITPRIVFMIINEAWYTFQEGTAQQKDIDTGMKLGTNYPKGPFEWCQLAGIENVYQTLLAVYEDTREERYKICPALKTARTRAAI